MIYPDPTPSGVSVLDSLPQRRVMRLDGTVWITIRWTDIKPKDKLCISGYEHVYEAKGCPNMANYGAVAVNDLGYKPDDVLGNGPKMNLKT